MKKISLIIIIIIIIMKGDYKVEYLQLWLKDEPQKFSKLNFLISVGKFVHQMIDSKLQMPFLIKQPAVLFVFL